MTKPRAFTDLPPSELIEHALTRNEGSLTDTGALLITTGKRTGRSPNDRFIVDEPSTSRDIGWGDVNKPFSEDKFEALWDRASEHLSQKDRFVSHLHVGAHEEHYLAVEVTTETAWQGLFGRNMFIKPEKYNSKNKKEWTILNVASFQCSPERDGTNSDGVVIINFKQKRVLLAGMRYAGEMKKAMFSVQNFLLPEKEVLPMHCSANVGEDGDTTLFLVFLVQEKQHCLQTHYATLLETMSTAGLKALYLIWRVLLCKIINLSQKNEPIIWDAICHGAIVENVVVDSNGLANYNDTSITENGRCSYPLEHVEKRVLKNAAGEPRVVIFLTCDVSGVLPPVSILSKEAAAYHFLSGYTARVGSTELGAAKGINPAFSPCFGAPFMPRPAGTYANLLIKRVADFGAQVYLVNSGWTGGSGAPGGTGERFPIPVTRAIVSACQSGALLNCKTKHLDYLNLDIPREIPGVDNRYLNPRDTWEDKGSYDAEVKKLASLFADNITKFDVDKAIIEAGPKIT